MPFVLIGVSALADPISDELEIAPSSLIVQVRRYYHVESGWTRLRAVRPPLIGLRSCGYSRGGPGVLVLGDSGPFIVGAAQVLGEHDARKQHERERDGLLCAPRSGMPNVTK